MQITKKRRVKQCELFGGTVSRRGKPDVPPQVRTQVLLALGFPVDTPMQAQGAALHATAPHEITEVDA